MNAPPWYESSPRKRSVMGACGLAAAMAGCESMIEAEV